MQVQEALAKIESMVGQQVGTGQCYALSAYYEYLINPDTTVELGGGVTRNISGLIKGGLNASDIGEDYRWNAQGWEVRYNPRDVSQIPVGCIINWYSGGMHTTGQFTVNEPYGHTGVVYAVENGVVYTYEQNNGGLFIRKFAGSNLTGISSVCIPPQTQKPKKTNKVKEEEEEMKNFVIRSKSGKQGYVGLVNGVVFGIGSIDTVGQLKAAGAIELNLEDGDFVRLIESQRTDDVKVLEVLQQVKAEIATKK